jgi:Escherichia/Staphylococcus phage prohead protease
MNGLRVGPKGDFSGYASLFGMTDQGGDRVMPGAFAASLSRRGAGAVRMLFQHDPKEPVGVWDRIEEDAKGLYVEGRLVADISRSDNLRKLIRAGAIDGLSIGFRTVRATKGVNGVRRLWRIDLWEVSIVTFPMLDAARIGHRADEALFRLSQSLGQAHG